VSALTIQLLQTTAPRVRRSYWHKTFLTIADRLEKVHGVPSLGNVEDPTWEVFYILLSSKTAEIQYKRAFRALRDKFGKLRLLSEATDESILDCIKGGGFGPKRSRRIRLIAKRLLRELGSRPSQKLRNLTAKDCFNYLKTLPGIGSKSALCVMMYSLHFDVFPVDVNIHRVAERLGALKAGLRTDQAQKLLPHLVPDGVCKRLHITMVLQGRTTCVRQLPRCESCQIRDLCPTGKRRS
jgi:endonuclease III